MDYVLQIKTDYTALRDELKVRLNQAANSFVEIGYLLKIARDTDILKQSGYTTMGEFASKEFSLSPDTASRFISIYEKFGDEQGHLQDKYTDHGYTKLVEMLQLPDSLAEEIPATVSREEIRDLKKIVQAEENITPLEVAMEDKGAAGDRDDLRRTLYSLFENDSVIYTNLWRAEIQPATDPGALSRGIELISTIMVSGGIGTVSTRVSGLGPMIISFKGADNDPVLINVRQDEKTPVTWPQFIEAVTRELYEEDHGLPLPAGAPIEAWEAKYHIEYTEDPKVSEIAPAQLEEEKPKNVQKTGESVQKTEKTGKKQEKTAKTEENRQESEKTDTEPQETSEKDPDEAPEEAEVTEKEPTEEQTEEQEGFTPEETRIVTLAAKLKKLADSIIDDTNNHTWTFEKIEEYDTTCRVLNVKLTGAIRDMQKCIRK